MYSNETTRTLAFSSNMENIKVKEASQDSTTTLEHFSILISSLSHWSGFSMIDYQETTMH